MTAIINDPLFIFKSGMLPTRTLFGITDRFKFQFTIKLRTPNIVYFAKKFFLNSVLSSLKFIAS